MIKWIRNSNDELTKTWPLLGCGITRKMPGMTLGSDPLAGNWCIHDMVVRDKACAGGKLGVVCWLSIGIPS